jgi:hypothetical protein
MCSPSLAEFPDRGPILLSRTSIIEALVEKIYITRMEDTEIAYGYQRHFDESSRKDLFSDKGKGTMEG